MLNPQRKSHHFPSKMVTFAFFNLLLLSIEFHHSLAIGIEER